jgi:small subunit ribosomal protein S4
MGRRLEPKCKQCRREGEKLFLRGERCGTAKCAMIRRSFRPGVHGPQSRLRPTPYGIQLREKQKAKETYGLLERQFRNYFEKAKKTVGNTAERLVQMLELRLDNVVFRLGLGKSRSQARQMVGHGLIRVNGKRVTIPSYQVKPGDIVAVAEKYRKSKLLENEGPRLEKLEMPSWLALDAKEMSGKVLNRPQGDELKQNFNPKLIVEFYSR